MDGATRPPRGTARETRPDSRWGTQGKERGRTAQPDERVVTKLEQERKINQLMGKSAPLPAPEEQVQELPVYLGSNLHRISDVEREQGPPQAAVGEEEWSSSVPRTQEKLYYIEGRSKQGKSGSKKQEHGEEDIKEDHCEIVMKKNEEENPVTHTNICTSRSSKRLGYLL